MSRYQDKKTWEELEPHEKIEDLRNDMKRVFAVVRDLYTAVNAQAARHRENDALLHEVAKAVEELEKKLSSPKKGG